MDSWKLAAQKLRLPELGTFNTAGLKINSIAYQDEVFAPVFEEKPQDVNIKLVQKSYQIGRNADAIPLIRIPKWSSPFELQYRKEQFLILNEFSRQFQYFGAK